MSCTVQEAREPLLQAAKSGASQQNSGSHPVRKGQGAQGTASAETVCHSGQGPSMRETTLHARRTTRPNLTVLFHQADEGER
ncbi:MAG TPA: hypothetical protein VFV38_39955 [Ktedonobacteraceae bacterium]|nr:hypothetical protein [Ktedonobacteraceae bacterium]